MGSPAVDVRDRWRPEQVQITSNEGSKIVPALVHDGVVGLAVTMLNFGSFEVTHLATGLKVVGGYERFGSACLSAARLSLIADWRNYGKTVWQEIEDHADEPVPFAGCTITTNGATRPQTKGDFFHSLRAAQLLREFPWESPDEDPFYLACKCLDELGVRSQTPETTP